ncbi:MAG TPA: hypothetical protein VGF77_05590 [Allosphingosinicella sp.]
MAKRTKRKVKTATQLQAEAEQRLRIRAVDSGIPEHRVAGERIRDYAPDQVIDLSGELGGGRNRQYQVLRLLYPTVVDRWLAEGGPGFEEPQRRAIEHCRALWTRLGTQGRLTARWDGVGGGRGDRNRVLEQAEAHAEIRGYEARLGMPWVWEVFELVVRHDEPAGAAASKLASNSAQRQAHAKACVGFVASAIAMWRGY